MTVRPGLRAALVLAGLAATVTVLAIGLVALPDGALPIACTIAILWAAAGAQVLLGRAWGVAVLPVVTAAAMLVPMTIDAAGEPAAHMWPVAVIGVIVFLIPALICFLVAVHWLAGVARRERARRAG
ncbi:hypothetical protein [Tsukamurella tyrosinosolvens]|uniref:hypothetical protein n=1 Tax=Tsukamurella tyrosinosolvens TaxID=57704 RepID=UPI002DD44220|nr:hypothetical protein [Tsukamurella tyrosinosolvens]MEC4614257.1 hypothetical protein [Tsukamurella tyrosinosolvens]